MSDAPVRGGVPRGDFSSCKQRHYTTLAPNLSPLSLFRTRYEAVMGIPLRTGGRDRCPAHDDRSPSLSVSEGPDGEILVYCFAGCAYESVVSALDLEVPDLFPTRVDTARLWRPRLSVSVSPRREPDDPERLGKTYEAHRKAFLRDTKMGHRFTEELGVSRTALDLLGVGWSGSAVTFPMRCPNGDLCGLRYRASGGGKWAETGSRNGLFLPLSMLDHRPRSIVVVEGPTDCLALLTLQIPVFGISSASHDSADVVAVVRRFGCDSVTLLLDSDDAGRRAAERIGGALFPYTHTLRDVSLPSGIKDAREWLGHGITRKVFIDYVAATHPIVEEVAR